MAKPVTTTPTKQPQLGLVDLFKEEQELKARLETIQRRKADMAREQADSIRKDVLIALEDIAQKIAPLVEQEAWSWRALPDFEIVLAELELQPTEAKSVEVADDVRELIVGFLGTQPHGATIDQIAAGVVDGTGAPRWKVGSLRPKLPVLVRDGTIKSRPHPQNGRQNQYFLEA